MLGNDWQVLSQPPKSKTLTVMLQNCKIAKIRSKTVHRKAYVTLFRGCVDNILSHVVW